MKYLCVAVLFAAVAVAFGQLEGPERPAAEPARSDMSLLEAAVLGVVEGVTEYLPVSSTGHLILTQRAMGIGDGEPVVTDDSPAGAVDGRRAKQAADAYAICIQAGAIIAVLGLYFRRSKQMVLGLAGRDSDGRRLAMNILAGFLPAAVIGLLINDWVKAHLFGGQRWGLWPIVAAWFVGGVAILLVAWRRRAHGDTPRTGHSVDQLTWRLALIIGFAQCIAMWPGVSRSLVTIVGGVLVGLSLPAAVEFSFLLGMVTLTAATVYDGLKSGGAMLELYGPLSILVGFAAATVSAALAVKWMVGYLNSHGLSIFGYYRVALAVGVAIFILAGWL